MRFALPLLFVLCLSARAEDEAFTPLFNGKNLSGWINVNCAPETWSVKDGVVHCTGRPTGALRTERQYENFVLELEWRHLKSGGNAGIFIWATPIAAPGVPFLRSIEVQVLDHGFNVKGKNEWYTTHGDVFPIHGTSMKPLGRSNGSRSFPSEERSKASPEWNHYRIECNNGSLRLHVNGKQVSGGDDCNYRKGYIGLESEGSPVEFKNIRIRELPPTNAPAEMTAPVDTGLRSLYTGVDLRNWKTDGDQNAHWKAHGFAFSYDGKGGGNLLSEQAYGDFELSLDCSSAQIPPVLVRGVKLPAFEFKEKLGGFKRWTVSVKGDRVSVTFNGKTVLDAAQVAGLPASGPVGFEAGAAPAQYANVYIRTLEQK